MWVCLQFCCEVEYTAFLTSKTGPRVHRLIAAQKLAKSYDNGRRTGLGRLPKWRWGDWAVHASAGAGTGEDGMRSATLVVMRHGESTWTDKAQNRFAGWVDVPLTERGRDQIGRASCRERV